MLEAIDVRASYGRAEVVRGVTLTVPPGRVVAVVGRNGAGKSTLANALAGLHAARTGRVVLDGTDVRRGDPVAAARAGISIVPQGRRLFGSLTVKEHFDLAGRHRREHAMTVEQILDRLPRLGDRLGVRARSLSGGEQQMVAIARAVLAGPRLLVMDEATEGLSPAMAGQVCDLVAHLAAAGTAVLMLEQSESAAGAVVHDCLALERGSLAAVPAPAPGPVPLPHGSLR